MIDTDFFEHRLSVHFFSRVRLKAIHSATIINEGTTIKKSARTQFVFILIVQDRIFFRVEA